MDTQKEATPKVKISWIGPKGKAFKRYRNRIMNSKVDGPVRTT